MRRRLILIAAILVCTVWGTVTTAHARAATPTPTPTSSAPPLVTDPPGVGLGPSPILPTPSPGSVIAPTPGSTGGDNSPGFFDIVGHIKEAIDGWFSDLVTAALTPILDLLGATVLATPDVTGPGRVHDLWAMFAGIANGLFVLLALVGGVIVMTHETVQTRYSVKEIAPRLVLGVIASNTSLAIAGLAIQFTNAMSYAVLGQGDAGSATAALRQLILAPLANAGIFVVLLGVAVAVLAVFLLCSYLARIATVVLLIVAAPLALATHALPQTEGLARYWWRAFAACLGIQFAQSLVLVTAIRVLLDPNGGVFGSSLGNGLIDILVSLCLFWVLIKIPTWAGRIVRGGRGGGSATSVTTVAYVTKTAIRAAKVAAAAL